MELTAEYFISYDIAKITFKAREIKAQRYTYQQERTLEISTY